MSVHVLSVSERTAFTFHTCWCCGGRIGAGERYMDQRCAADGRAYTLRHHLLCWAIYEGDEDQSWDAGAEALHETLAAIVPVMGARS